MLPNLVAATDDDDDCGGGGGDDDDDWGVVAISIDRGLGRILLKTISEFLRSLSLSSLR
jgi:hypothetical protein